MHSIYWLVAKITYKNNNNARRNIYLVKLITRSSRRIIRWSLYIYVGRLNREISCSRKQYSHTRRDAWSVSSCFFAGCSNLDACSTTSCNRKAHKMWHNSCKANCVIGWADLTGGASGFSPASTLAEKKIMLLVSTRWVAVIKDPFTRNTLYEVY